MQFKQVRDLDWNELNDKVVQIKVLELSADHPGQVWAFDIDGTAYLLEEWYTEEEND